MKAAVGGFFHESNSFCSLSTTLKGFKEHTYLDTENVDEFVNAFADAREITGFVKALISHDATIVPLPVAMALPSGPVTYDTYAHIKKRMLEELQATPVDAVFLNLHGAAVVENIDDTEGDLLKSIRSIIGMDIPIFTVLDLHANVSQDMVDMSTVILGYNTEPHIDILERETECVDIFYRMKEEHLTLQTVIVQPPLLLPAICTDTTEGAMAPIMRAAFEAETNPEVINVSPFAGFYGSDKYCAGPSVICTTINNRQLAFDIASKISHLIWQLKDTFFVKLTPIPEIIRNLKEHPDKKFAIIDECDDPLGGGPADGTYILDCLSKNGINNIGVSTIRDSDLVQQAFSVGEGQYIDGMLGSHTDHLHGSPISIHAKVIKLFREKIPMSDLYPHITYDVGKIAVIDTGYAEVVITDQKVPTEMIDIFKYLGIDSKKYSILILKGFGHSYKDVFKNAVDEYITAESIGVNNPDITKIGDFKKLRHPIYPFDKDTTY